MTEKAWLDEFSEFVKTEGAPVPEQLSKKILNTVYSSLNPSAWIVFLKLLGIHSIVGTLSLAICNQFGLNPFQTNISLSEYFMSFGHSVCMTLCGVLFVGLSATLAALFLRNEEVRVLRKNLLIQVFVLSSASLAVFIAFGAEVALGIGVLWLLGALLGGIIPVLILSRPQTQFA